MRFYSLLARGLRALRRFRVAAVRRRGDAQRADHHYHATLIRMAAGAWRHAATTQRTERTAARHATAERWGRHRALGRAVDGWAEHVRSDRRPRRALMAAMDQVATRGYESRLNWMENRPTWRESRLNWRKNRPAWKHSHHIID